jgi:deferrochelatase/peroxidase EfeB
VAILQQSLTGQTEPGALELEDIQHFLMSRPPARAARYEFLTFRTAACGRAWLTGLIDKVGTAKSVGSNLVDSRWVTIGFTWNGLYALGVDDASLATFPEEFRQGMAARAEILGTTGANHPDHWVGGLARADLHAIAILFARDVAERERCRLGHERYVAQCAGVELLSALDLEAIPPFDYAHEHFGYRDRLSQPVIEGTEAEPTPGSGPPIKPGEFFLGYADEEGPAVGLPRPEILSRNGSYVAYIRMQEHVGAFRDFLRAHGETPEQQEWVAAKLMGRWRSGAPLVLAPDKDDPSLGSDYQRNNDFKYAA